MSDYERMLVVENGTTVFIQDEAGNKVAFTDFAEALSVTGHDFTGKFYIGYEPHIDLFTDSRDPTVNNSMIPYIPYEGFIDNVQVYESRLADHYYGLDEAEALTVGKAAKRAEILARYQVEEDLLEITYATNNYSASPQNIVELYVEHELASLNSETTVIVFDTLNEPHTINIASIIPALQSMRVIAKELRTKGRGYLVDINNATTLTEVEAIAWQE